MLRSGVVVGRAGSHRPLIPATATATATAWPPGRPGYGFIPPGAAAPEALGDTLQLLIEGAFAVAPSIGNEAAATALRDGAKALLGVSLSAGGAAAGNP
jgi:hypothetical protein